MILAISSSGMSSLLASGVAEEVGMGLGVAASRADRAVVSSEGWLSEALVLGGGAGAVGALAEEVGSQWRGLWSHRLRGRRCCRRLRG